MQITNPVHFADKPAGGSGDRRGPKRGAIPTPKKIIEESERYIPPSTPEPPPAPPPKRKDS